MKLKKHFDMYVQKSILSLTFLGLLAILLNGIASSSENIDANSHSHTQVQADSFSALIQTPTFNKNMLSRELLLDSQRLTDFVLSPDGKHLSYIEKHQKKNSISLQTLWIKRLSTASRGTQVVKLLTSKKIGQVYWSSDSQYLFLKQDNKLSVVKIDAIQGAKIIYRSKPNYLERWLGVNPYLPNSMLLVSQEPTSGDYQLYNVDTGGKKTLVFSSQYQILDVLVNEAPIEHNKIRFAAGTQALFSKETVNGVNQIVDRRFPELIDLARQKSRSRPLVECEFHDPCQLLHYQQNTQELHMLARIDEDLASLFKFELLENDERIAPILVHQDPQQKFDITHVHFANNHPKMVQYQGFFTHYIGLDSQTKKQISRLQQHVEQSQGSYFNISTSVDFKTWLVRFKSANMQNYRLVQFDGKTVTSLSEPLLSLHFGKKQVPGIRQISARIAVEYQVSDGMQQFGYITTPKGNELNFRQFPLVVMPHGGPWSRSTGDYSILADFIASRGYVVFEPNFRASSGMGKQYMVSANKEFGDGIVQQDILDGMQVVLDMGYGDPANKAIVGHSFGGFSALGGVSFTPDIFEVAFAGAPPVDLLHSIEYLARQDFLNVSAAHHLMLQEYAVNTNDAADKARLSAHSPEAYLQNIQRPVYLWAGKHDDRVDIRKVKKYATTLRDKNKNLMLLIDPYSGHSPSNRLAFDAYLFLLEKSLHVHLGGLFDEEKSEYLRRYLASNTVINTLN